MSVCVCVRVCTCYICRIKDVFKWIFCDFSVRYLPFENRHQNIIFFRCFSDKCCSMSKLSLHQLKLAELIINFTFSSSQIFKLYVSLIVFFCHTKTSFKVIRETTTTAFINLLAKTFFQKEFQKKWKHFKKETDLHFCRHTISNFLHLIQSIDF